MQNIPNVCHINSISDTKMASSQAPSPYNRKVSLSCIKCDNKIIGTYHLKEHISTKHLEFKSKHNLLIKDSRNYWNKQISHSITNGEYVKPIKVYLINIACFNIRIEKKKSAADRF